MFLLSPSASLLTCYSFQDVLLKEDLFHKLPSLPNRSPSELDNDHVDSTRRILKSWHQRQNAVLIDDQVGLTTLNPIISLLLISQNKQYSMSYCDETRSFFPCC